MAKQTKVLGMYAEMARDLEREVKRALITALQEDDLLARADGMATADLTKKYNLDAMEGTRG